MLTPPTRHNRVGDVGRVDFAKGNGFGVMDAGTLTMRTVTRRSRSCYVRIRMVDCMQTEMHARGALIPPKVALVGTPPTIEPHGL